MCKFSEVKNLWEKKYVSNAIKVSDTATDYVDKWEAVLFSVNSNDEIQRYCSSEEEYLKTISHIEDDGKIEIMPCGCRVAGRNMTTGLPVCVVHNTQGTVLVNEKELLKGRKAKCIWCGNIRDSSFNLPFFKYQPDKDEDSFYCGCDGWD